MDEPVKCMRCGKVIHFNEYGDPVEDASTEFGAEWTCGDCYRQFGNLDRETLPSGKLEAVRESVLKGRGRR